MVTSNLNIRFVKVLLQGPQVNIESSGSSDTDATMHQRSKIASGICQLIIYNSIQHSSIAKTTTQIRHSRDRETPLPLYIGIKMHSNARLKHLVDTFHQLGLSVWYDRIREVNVAVAISVYKRIENDGVVLPSNMRSGVFTSGDMDHLDHHRTSN